MMISAVILVSLGVVAYLFWPLLEKQQQAHQTPTPLRDLRVLYFERARLMENMTDLDLDLQLQKVEPADYQSLRQELLLQLSDIYEKIQSTENNHAFFASVEKDVKSL
jgi:hypothetical protein